MNNIELINKKKKYSNITHHGDIIGNTRFHAVDPHIENKLSRPTKRVGFVNGLESKTAIVHGKKKISTPYDKPVTGDNTILNPKPEIVVTKKREYPPPEPRKTETHKRSFPSRDLPKDHWVFDPIANRNVGSPRNGKRILSAHSPRRNILTGETSDVSDFNGLGILPSVSLAKGAPLRNTVRPAKTIISSSVSHNILHWE